MHFASLCAGAIMYLQSCTLMYLSFILHPYLPYSFSAQSCTLMYLGFYFAPLPFVLFFLHPYVNSFLYFNQCVV